MNKEIPDFIDACQLPSLQEQENIELIDIRDSVSFMQGHLPNSQSITPETLATQVETLDNSKHYIIICYHGISAVSVAENMRQFGLKASVLKDGMAAFQ